MVGEKPDIILPLYESPVPQDLDWTAKIESQVCHQSLSNLCVNQLVTYYQILAMQSIDCLVRALFTCGLDLDYIRFVRSVMHHATFYHFIVRNMILDILNDLLFAPRNFNVR